MIDFRPKTIFFMHRSPGPNLSLLIYAAKFPRDNKTNIAKWKWPSNILSIQKRMCVCQISSKSYGMNWQIEWKWRIKINPSKKSSRCILRRTKKFHPHTNIQFQKQDITWTNHAKYIGVTLDQQQKSINLYQKSIEKLRQ